MQCTPAIDRNSSVWSKVDFSRWGRALKTGPENVNDLQMRSRFTGSDAQPAASPIFPRRWVCWDDRCQVHTPPPPPPIPHPPPSPASPPIPNPHTLPPLSLLTLYWKTTTIALPNLQPDQSIIAEVGSPSSGGPTWMQVFVSPITKLAN